MIHELEITYDVDSKWPHDRGICSTHESLPLTLIQISTKLNYFTVILAVLGLESLDDLITLLDGSRSSEPKLNIYHKLNGTLMQTWPKVSLQT